MSKPVSRQVFRDYIKEHVDNVGKEQLLMNIDL